MSTTTGTASSPARAPARSPARWACPLDTYRPWLHHSEERERQYARQAHDRGQSAAEIAWQLGASLSRVRAYLNG